MPTTTLDAPRGRITARVSRAHQDMLEEAAAFLGIPVNSFVVTAAMEKAGEVLETQRTIRMSARDAAVIAESLSNPPAPNAALLEAGKVYKEMIRG
jgi:uncharacterized protein (DUF1778 family)